MPRKPIIRSISLFLCLLLVFSVAQAGLTLLVSALTPAEQALPEAKREYIADIGEYASADMQSSGILASLTVTQAIIEAGWGNSTMARLANNLFGMKASSSWTGMVYDSNEGVVYASYGDYIAAKGSDYASTYSQKLWRAYSTHAESLADHSRLLASAKRYQNLVGEYDYVAAAWNIIEDGYASDMEYCRSMINAIEIYGLSRFDVIEYPEDEVVITCKSRAYIPIGESYTLPVTVIQPFGQEDEITFESSDESVLSVDENGVITAHQYGEALITAYSSTGWHACCYAVGYDPNTFYRTYICSGSVDFYAEPDKASDYYGYLMNGTRVVTIGDKFTGEDGNEWMMIRAKGITASAVTIHTGYVLASKLNYSSEVSYESPYECVSVTVDRSELTLEAYKTADLTADIKSEQRTVGDKTYDYPTNMNLRWISSDPSVATVSNGSVRGVSEGVCTVYAVSPDGAYASCEVTVTPGVYVAVESVELSTCDITINLGETGTVTATVLPADSTETKVKWSSSDNTVAKVVNGTITAVGTGTCTVTASCGGVSADCTVNVVNWIYDGIKYSASITADSVRLREGPSTSYGIIGQMNTGDQLTVYGDAENGWYYVKVLSGKLAGEEGYVFGEYISISGEYVESLVFKTADSVINKGESLTLLWTVNPSGSTVTFESSDPSVASVASDGTVTAVSAGTAVISIRSGSLSDTVNITVTDNAYSGTKYRAEVNTGTSNLNIRSGPGTKYDSLGKIANGTVIIVFGSPVSGDGLNWYAANALTISGEYVSGYVCADYLTLLGPAVDSLSLITDHASIPVGDTFVLTYNVSPENAAVSFSSSNPEVATVSDSGVITAHSEGTAEITVTAGGLSDVFTAVVIPSEYKPEKPSELLTDGTITVSPSGRILGLTENTSRADFESKFLNDRDTLVFGYPGSLVGTGATVTLTDPDTGEALVTACVVLLGDCDGNGTVNATDYLIIKRMVLGTYEASELQMQAACVSSGATVSATDYLMVKRHYLGTYYIYG